MFKLLFITILALITLSYTFADDTIVTYGSSIKFTHKNSSYQLHASNVAWGSGSAELAVTAINDKSSPNTLWQIQQEYQPTNPEVLAPYGNPVRCGDVIRLRHSTTQTFLRSQLHRAPISGRQEVSSENKGDKMNENFTLICLNGIPTGTQLTQSTPIKLKHKKSNQFLYTRSNDNFNNQNCHNCPIVGHFEVSCSTQDDGNNIWTMTDGFYIPVNTDRVIYDYNDFSAEPKILFDSKVDNLAPKTNDATTGTKKSAHDEL